MTKAWLVGIALVAGCQHGAPQGSVSGDVFLLMQNGDVKRGAGNAVLLLGPADSVLATRGRVCAAYGQQLLADARRGGRQPATDMVMTTTHMISQLDSTLHRAAVASSPT